jgi:hypothetical protein
MRRDARTPFVARPVAAIPLVLVAYVLNVGCGGSDGGSGPPPSGTPSYSGTYQTDVSLGQSSCTNVTIQPMPTTVTHTAASGEVRFAHGGLTWAGTVAADSTFSTPAQAFDLGDGFSYRSSLAGRFTRTGFTAAVQLERTTKATSAVCSYVVNWTGRK